VAGDRKPSRDNALKFVGAHAGRGGLNVHGLFYPQCVAVIERRDPLRQRHEIRRGSIFQILIRLRPPQERPRPLRFEPPAISPPAAMMARPPAILAIAPGIEPTVRTPLATSDCFDWTGAIHQPDPSRAACECLGAMTRRWHRPQDRGNRRKQEN